jgi:hypothetical protein
VNDAKQTLDAIRKIMDAKKREPKTDPLHETSCLSLNDVLSCCHIEDAAAGILYLHIEDLEDLAKEKTGL